MKLINADKYKKDIEHYRNTICYQRNVTMDDCMRILDKQEDVLDKIRAEIEEIKTDTMYEYVGDFRSGVNTIIEIIDRYRNEVSE